MCPMSKMQFVKMTTHNYSVDDAFFLLVRLKDTVPPRKKDLWRTISAKMQPTDQMSTKRVQQREREKTVKQEVRGC